MTNSLDVGLALALSTEALDQGIEEWLAPVRDGLFDSVWSLENPLTEQAEPLIWLTAAATLCPDTRVGTAALIAPIREPLLLARQVATIDRLTGGRLDLGVTIGRRPGDYEAHGADFHRRGRLLDETINALRELWSRTGGSTAIGPRPVRDGGPAILVGGHADAALARVIRLGDGFLAGATSGPAHAVAALDRLRHLSDELALAPVSRAVANVFVQPGRSADEAIRAAMAIFTERHGGAPPWDPSAVVVAGPEDVIAERLADMHLRGFSGLNLVPVDMTLDGVSAVAAVASRLSSLR